MSVTLLRADARSLPLGDSMVDLIVTSPPYFGLRSYQDGGEHYTGQIGDEATPAEFVDALIECTREMVRVLKPSGSIWVNLGDKYVADNRGSSSDAKRGAAKWAPRGKAGYVGEGIMPRKSLMGIPWRYAIRCIDDLGLILRAEVIWSKPNGLPESVTDRVRRSHENWFHFTKEPRYYSSVDRIRDESQQDRPQTRRALELASRAGLTDEHREALKARGLSDVGRGAAVQDGTGKNTERVQRLAAEASAALGGYAREFLLSGPSLGKLPGSVQTVATEPLQVPDSLGVDHYAAFPTWWPRWIIQGWSPEGGTVLDPFGGTGTTALCADVLGRHGISVDMSADYLRIAQWRTTDPKQRAKAARVEYRPPVEVPDGQATFDLGGIGA